MTPTDRKNAAEQLLANPLLAEIFEKLERGALNTCVYEDDEQKRAAAAYRVRAIRAFRSDCEEIIHSTRTGDGE